MINDELLIERLTRRIEKANTYFLTKIGSSIKKIKSLTPTQAQQLVQMLKYGGDYEKIIKELSKYTDMNINELNDIFSAYAKEDSEFSRGFYEYRNIPFRENPIFTAQKNAIIEIAKNEMYNYTRSNVLGYTINGKFHNLRDTYNQLLEEALLNVSQGKETFDTAMSKILKEIGGSGLKTLDYESGRSIRLDSAINMHLKGRLRELHNENQKQIGLEIGSDGIEISVHENPAEDHEKVQGRQFSNEEFEKLNSGLEATDYTGKKYTLDHDGKNGYRPISEMNCYHYVFSIVLGVSRPAYNDDELKNIIDRNEKGFDFNGKHYSMYQGEQLQRNIEREIRKQKDIQILARESGNNDLALQSQGKINKLTKKYKELSDVSGLPVKMDRLKVSGYRKIKVDNIVKPKIKIEVNNKEDLLEKWNNIYKNDNIVVKHILNADPRLIDEQIIQVDSLLNKYKFVKNDINNDYKTNELTMQVSTPDMIGENNYARFFGGHYIEFNEKYFKEKDLLIDNVKNKILKNWWQEVDTENYNIYPVTHEFGHLLEYKMIENIEHAKGYIGSLGRGDYMQGDLKIFKEISKQVPDIEKYVSGYGKSTPRFEWFAETFTQMELGKETPVTKALKKYIDDFIGGNYEYFR